MHYFIGEIPHYFLDCSNCGNKDIGKMVITTTFLDASLKCSCGRITRGEDILICIEKWNILNRYTFVDDNMKYKTVTHDGITHTVTTPIPLVNGKTQHEALKENTVGYYGPKVTKLPELSDHPKHNIVNRCRDIDWNTATESSEVYHKCRECVYLQDQVCVYKKACTGTILAEFKDTVATNSLIGANPDDENAFPNGLKYDEGKLRYDLIPPEYFRYFAEVFTMGANKYPANSWKNVDPHKYYAAMMRHLVKWLEGHEPNDPESGYSHLKHALWNLGAITWMEEQKNQDAD